MERFRQGRRSVAEFCRREGVSEFSFYYWRKRLTEQTSEEETSAGQEVARFTPVRLLGATNVDVRLPGGTQLHVPTGDSQALRLVIETIARLDGQRVGGGSC